MHPLGNSRSEAAGRLGRSRRCTHNGIAFKLRDAVNRLSVAVFPQQG
ncbi:hypothetical protein ACFQY5_41240 [Paeniroseomonas aquatica]